MFVAPALLSSSLGRYLLCLPGLPFLGFYTDEPRQLPLFGTWFSSVHQQLLHVCVCVRWYCVDDGGVIYVLVEGCGELLSVLL